MFGTNRNKRLSQDQNAMTIWSVMIRVILLLLVIVLSGCTTTPQLRPAWGPRQTICLGGPDHYPVAVVRAYLKPGLVKMQDELEHAFRFIPCDVFDVDGDGDVDLRDVAELLRGK